MTDHAATCNGPAQCCEAPLDSAEFRKFYKVSKGTLSDLCSKGLPHFYVGATRRFRLSETEAWFRQQTGAKDA